MADEKRNYFKMAGYLVLIGASAILINYVYTNLVAEWKKPAGTVGVLRYPEKRG